MAGDERPAPQGAVTPDSHSPSPAGTFGAAGDPADGPQADEDAAFRLQLPVFEGPLDLLLHLIERRELDITEVSLLEVAEQYLEFLRRSDQIQLDALAQFIAVGARLLLLKSRALLPRDAHDEDELLLEDEPDDARDLVEALREYRRYREAAEFLRGRDEHPHGAYRRDAEPPEVPAPSGLDEEVTLEQLADLFREVLARMPEEREPPPVPRQRVRLRDRMSSLVDVLERQGRLSFQQRMVSATSRLTVVVDFLAVLELIKAGFLQAKQSEAFGDIELVRVADAHLPDVATLARAFDSPGEDAGAAGEDPAGDTGPDPPGQAS